MPIPLRQVADRVVSVNGQALEPWQQLGELLKDQLSLFSGTLEFGVLRELRPSCEEGNASCSPNSHGLDVFDGGTKAFEEGYTYHLAKLHRVAGGELLGLQIVIDEEGQSVVEGVEKCSAAARCAKVQAPKLPFFVISKSLMTVHSDIILSVPLRLCTQRFTTSQRPVQSDVAHLSFVGK